MQSTHTLSDEIRMDRHYRFQRHIYDSTRTHYLIGRQHLIRNLGPKDGQSVLEIGCGTAWNIIRVAKRYPKAKIYGLDVSNAMLATAEASVARQGLGERITLRQGDATNFDPQNLFGIAGFDRVFISYALSMIPQWDMALDNAAARLAPCGELHIVDFGQCGDLPLAFKRGLFAFLAHYTVRPRADFAEKVQAAAARHGLEAHVTRLHRGYTDYAVLRRP